MPRKPTVRRTESTTSCEVVPEGLLTTIIPSKGAGLGGRGIDFGICSTAADSHGGIVELPFREADRERDRGSVGSTRPPEFLLFVKDFRSGCRTLRSRRA